MPLAAGNARNPIRPGQDADPGRSERHLRRRCRGGADHLGVAADICNDTGVVRSVAVDGVPPALPAAAVITPSSSFTATRIGSSAPP